ncbi:MAG: prolyl oligopeptidase family serine peptidase [Thermotogota bacterium]
MRREYPEARRSDQQDAIHGVIVRDPYRWLEDLTSAETREWVHEQGILSRSFLDALPLRPAIVERYSRLLRFPEQGLPQIGGQRAFLVESDGVRPRPVLCWRSLPGLGDPHVLIDQEKLEDGREASVVWFAPSPSSALVAYGISEAGSDWHTIRVRGVETGRDLEDRIPRTRFPALAWLPDETGFAYVRFEVSDGDKAAEARLERRTICVHRLGDSPAEDTVLRAAEVPHLRYELRMTDDKGALAVTEIEPRNRHTNVRWLDLASGQERILIDGFTGVHRVLGNDSGAFYVLTTLGAPNGRIVRTSAGQGQNDWVVVVPESAGAIESAALVQDVLVVSYTEDVVSHLILFSTSGRELARPALPAPGTVLAVRGNRRDEQYFVLFTSVSQPPTVLSGSVSGDDLSCPWQRRLPFEPLEFETAIDFCSSKDGTRVPVIRSWKKGTWISPQTPTLLHGYGGFGISQTPRFRAEHLLWMDMGGQVATACVRGGTEYGRAWHQAGVRERRQNVFDDFIAAAEWLVEQRLASTRTLVAEGRSAGGHLVGTCVVQRPDLFAAVFAASGVYDMLRFHRFGAGGLWASEHGSPDDPAMVPILHGYSPYHNAGEHVEYPAVLLSVGAGDDRVHPSHSYKFGAALQRAQDGDAPILVRIDQGVGHGPGTPRDKRIRETADEIAFLASAIRWTPQLD